MSSEVIAIFRIVYLYFGQNPKPDIIYKMMKLRKNLKNKILPNNISKHITKSKIYHYVDDYARKSLMQWIKKQIILLDQSNIIWTVSEGIIFILNYQSSTNLEKDCYPFERDNFFSDVL